ncbi:MAG: hypothetical protein ACREBC_17300 [Pyrinomonadaceae bacterium]
MSDCDGLIIGRIGGSTRLRKVIVVVCAGDGRLRRPAQVLGFFLWRVDGLGRLAELVAQAGAGTSPRARRSAASAAPAGWPGVLAVRRQGRLHCRHGTEQDGVRAAQTLDHIDLIGVHRVRRQWTGIEFHRPAPNHRPQSLALGNSMR